MPPRRRARPCCRSRGTRTRRRGCCSRGAARGGRAARSPRRRRRRRPARKSRRREDAHASFGGVRGASADGRRAPPRRGRRVQTGVGAAPLARKSATGRYRARLGRKDPGTAAARRFARRRRWRRRWRHVFLIRERGHTRRIGRGGSNGRIRMRKKSGSVPSSGRMPPPWRGRRGGGGARRGDHGRVGKNRESVRGLARATATRLGDRTASNACVSSSILTHRSSHRATVPRVSGLAAVPKKEKALPKSHASETSQ